MPGTEDRTASTGGVGKARAAALARPRLGLYATYMRELEGATARRVDSYGVSAASCVG